MGSFDQALPALAEQISATREKLRPLAHKAVSLVPPSLGPAEPRLTTMRRNTTFELNALECGTYEEGESSGRSSMSDALASEPLDRLFDVANNASKVIDSFTSYMAGDDLLPTSIRPPQEPNDEAQPAKGEV